MKNLYAKIAKVQAELPTVMKSEENPYHKSKYADINAFIAVLRPILAKHNLMVMQPLEDGRLMTVIADPESGEEMKSAISIPPQTDMQKLGAAVTYLRRFSLVSAFLMEARDDDAESIVRDVQKAFSKPKEEAPLTPEDPFYEPPTGEGVVSYVEKNCEKCLKPFKVKSTDTWRTMCISCFKETKTK